MGVLPFCEFVQHEAIGIALETFFFFAGQLVASSHVSIRIIRVRVKVDSDPRRVESSRLF